MTYSFVFLDEFQDTTAIQYAFVKELWGISGMRENDTFDEMQRKLSAVVNVVKKNIQQKLDTEQWHSTLNSIIDFFGIGNIKAKFPAYKQGTYFMNVINQFESLFFEEYVAAHGVWNLAIENFRGDHSVPIMTIHKSKGLEYNAVYFIGLEDSAFWNFRNQPDEDRCISMGHTIFHCFVVPKQLHDRHKEFNDRQWSESSRCGCKIKAFANL